MSFAPPKKDPSRSTIGDKKGSVYGIDAPYSIHQKSRMTTYTEVDVNTRIDMLESNLGRVTNQQDSLLPLMNMLEIAPNVAKNDNLVKNLHKKSQESEDKILRLELMLKNMQAALDQGVTKIANQAKAPQFDAGLFERNMKQLGDQINEQKKGLSNLQNKFANNKKIIEAKLQEEHDNNAKQIESKIDKYSVEFNNAITEMRGAIESAFAKFDEGLKQLADRSNKFEEFAKENTKESILEEVNDSITAKFQEQTDFFKEKYDQQLELLNKDNGVLRCEMDIMNEEKKAAKIGPKIQSITKETDPIERKLRIHSIEQDYNLGELEKFNRDNTQRLMYELQNFDDKLDAFLNKFAALDSSRPKGDRDEELKALDSELGIINEKYTGLKYQIEGAKKKYFFDMTKVNDKMENLSQIKKDAETELSTNNKLKKTLPEELKTVDAYPERINQLMEAININLDTTFRRLEIVEEKLKESEGTLRRK